MNCDGCGIEIENTYVGFCQACIDKRLVWSQIDKSAKEKVKTIYDAMCIEFPDHVELIADAIQGVYVH